MHKQQIWNVLQDPEVLTAAALGSALAVVVCFLQDKSHLLEHGMISSDHSGTSLCLLLHHFDTAQAIHGCSNLKLPGSGQIPGSPP